MIDTGYNRFTGFVATNWTGYQNLIEGGVGIATIYIPPPDATAEEGIYSRTDYDEVIPSSSTIDEIWIRFSMGVQGFANLYRLRDMHITSGSTVVAGELLQVGFDDYFFGGAFDAVWGLTQEQAKEFVLGDGNTERFHFWTEKVGGNNDPANIAQLAEVQVRVLYTQPQTEVLAPPPVF